MPRMILGALVALVALRGGGAANEKDIEPEAEARLRQMTDYLAGLRSFRVQSHHTDELVLPSGEKLQVAGDSQLAVERPRRLRSEPLGPSGLALYYDGRQMTLLCRADQRFARVPAPPTLDETIDTARSRFHVEAPGADLLYSQPYAILTEQVVSGHVVGRETIDGAPAHHLAFVGLDVDWQVWIADGARPLPVRFVITSKALRGQPEFTVRFDHWETRAQLGAAAFAFRPPPGARAPPRPRSPAVPSRPPSSRPAPALPSVARRLSPVAGFRRSAAA